MKLRMEDTSSQTTLACIISRKITAMLTFLKAKYKSNTATDNNNRYLRTEISLAFMNKA
jgi:hypothetical protein